MIVHYVQLSLNVYMENQNVYIGQFFYSDLIFILVF